MSKIEYVKKNIDSVLVLTALAKLTYGDLEELNENEQLVMQALKRAVPELESSASLEGIQEYLQGLNENQLFGLSNNVKGILHEIQFVKIENEDGDEFRAALFTDTNHPNTDVQITNINTGETMNVQLKATDSSSYINEWISTHGEGTILVTDEIAERMGLESTGITNEGLTVEVSEFATKLMKIDNDDLLWNYIPELPAISIAISGYYLLAEYRKGNISLGTFKSKFLRLTGTKLVKLTLILVLMTIPGVNIAVGSALLFSLLYNTGTLVNRSLK